MGFIIFEVRAMYFFFLKLPHGCDDAGIFEALNELVMSVGAIRFGNFHMFSVSGEIVDVFEHGFHVEGISDFRQV